MITLLILHPIVTLWTVHASYSSKFSIIIMRYVISCPVLITVTFVAWFHAAVQKSQMTLKSEHDWTSEASPSILQILNECFYIRVKKYLMIRRTERPNRHEEINDIILESTKWTVTFWSSNHFSASNNRSFLQDVKWEGFDDSQWTCTCLFEFVSMKRFMANCAWWKRSRQPMWI